MVLALDRRGFQPRPHLSAIAVAISAAAHVAILLALKLTIVRRITSPIEVEIRETAPAPPPLVTAQPLPPGPAATSEAPPSRHAPEISVTPESVVNDAGPGAVAAPVGPPPRPLHQVTAAPKFRERAEPVFPEAMRRDGREGVVVLEVEVDESGRAAAVTVAESAGPEFDAAAVAAVKASLFEPARIGDVPVRVRIRIPVTFRLVY